MAVANVFTKEELLTLNAEQLKRVLAFMKVSFDHRMKKARLIELILEHQAPTVVGVYGSVAPEGIQMSARVRRIKENNHG